MEHLGGAIAPSPRTGMLHLPLPLDHLHYKIPREGGKGLRPVGVRPSPPVAAMATIWVGASRFDPQEGMGTTLLHTHGAAAMAATPEAP